MGARTVSGSGRFAAAAVMVLVSALLPVLAWTSPASAAGDAVPGAAFTSTNTAVDGPGHCANGNEDVNCNLYDGKQFVWLEGGPASAYAGDGDYFFAVLAPGGQADPNDGGPKNLSDDSDSYADRTFSVSAGIATYAGPHDFSGNKIRLMPYADTPNAGGVYTVAICSLAKGYPVRASDCVYDAFKVVTAETPAAGLTVVKDAAGSYDQTYTWGIAKDVDRTLVKQVGGSATFSYTVTATHDAGVVGNVAVSGTITVFNPNAGSVAGVTVADMLSDGTSCAVTDGSNRTLATGDTTFAYACQLPSLPSGPLNNTVTVTWPTQVLSDGALAAGSANFVFPDISFARHAIDDCASVSDSMAGSLGTVCVGGPNPATFQYDRSVPVPRFDCVSYDNTASFTTDDTQATGSALRTVTVCGPVHTGALTMGFWQNKNGQGILKSGAASAGVCNVGTWLRTFAPFQDLSATASCSQVAGYVTTVVKAANASGSSMNAMLKAQMLATALDVYFSDSALGGNRIGAPAPIGGVSVDLTSICRDLACAGFEDASGAFGGVSSLTVSQLLTTAAAASSAGGVTWYGNVKAVQELAKDTFDAVNNELVFAP